MNHSDANNVHGVILYIRDEADKTANKTGRRVEIEESDMKTEKDNIETEYHQLCQLQASAKEFINECKMEISMIISMLVLIKKISFFVSLERFKQEIEKIQQNKENFVC